MILVDAHVHIHDCFDLQSFLDSALSNFKAEAARRSHDENFSALLLLTESENTNWFQLLETYADENRLIGPRNSGWTFHRTSEICTIWAKRNGGEGLFLVAGRQIVTGENLEVLALATIEQFRDGLFLRDIIKNVRDSGAIPVIPWGVGKWIGHREAVLRDTMRTVRSSWLFLGDNSGRPVFWPRPSHFKEAEANGLRILSGSDPLPFPSEASRPGSFGFILQTCIDAQKPARDVKTLLFDPEVSVQPFGRLERPFRFFKNQLRMQVRKLRRTA